MRRILLAGVAALLAWPVWATDLALVIGNERYRNADRLSSADIIVSSERSLTDAGFRVVRGRNLTSNEMRDVVTQLNDAADGTGRIVIAVTGHFANSYSDSWWLGTDARRPNLAQVGTQGISIGFLLDIASRSPGGAVLLFADDGRDMRLGRGLTAGLPRPDMPQGVTLITGSSRDIAGFINQDLTQPGQTIAAGLENWPSLQASGFVSRFVPFLPAVLDDLPVGGGSVGPAPRGTSVAEIAFWGATSRAGTAEAFQNYLKTYPNGRFVDVAREKLAGLRTPQQRAQEAEAALNLPRNIRRAIQSNLTLLGFDTRGVDGIFGRGSRAAIANWQNDNGELATGYLNRSQIDRVQQQAERRSRELEEEARQRQAELERRDRAYWRATGRRGNEAGLREYLERYPDGVFAEVATERLAPFEQRRREAAAAQDRAEWDVARQLDQMPAYQDYVSRYPEGAFVENARERMAELAFQSRNRDALQAAARNEERLGLQPGARKLVEDRLKKFGLKPGAVDGTFDDNTRRAIRRFQDTRNLTVTGFLDRRTFAQLIADSLFK
jgi:peptidoglycan hydrolase-like protein with peptidoglycan-binding domain